MDMHRIEKNAGAGLTTIGKLIQESKVESNEVLFSIRLYLDLIFKPEFHLMFLFVVLGVFKSKKQV